MAGVIKTKQGITTDGKKGGIFIGDRHSNKSGGIPIVVEGGGSALVEDSEPVIIPEAVNNPKKHLFDGKQMTSKEILSAINTKYGGVPIKKKGGMIEKYDKSEVEEFASKAKFKTSKSNDYSYFDIDSDNQIRITKGQKSPMGNRYYVTLHERQEDGFFDGKIFKHNQLATSLKDAKIEAAKIYFNVLREETSTDIDLENSDTDYSNFSDSELKKKLDSKFTSFSESEQIVKELNKRGVKYKQGGSIPVKAGSVIITRNAALDKNTKHNFNGKQLTNTEVLSEINKDGGGVEFEEGGKVGEDINESNFFKATRAEFNPIILNKKYFQIIENWEEIKKKGEWHRSPSSRSEYVTTKNGVYRLSNHWDIFFTSTCYWQMKGAEKELWSIGYCDYKDFNKMDDNDLSNIIKERKSKYNNGGIIGKALELLQSTPVPSLFQQAKEDNPEELIKYIAEQGQGLHDDNKEALYNSTCKMFGKELTDASIEAYPIGYKEGGEVLLAPNGKRSNLTKEQWHLVRTDSFKKWFGDWENDAENASKVVDENGEPLVVYHGSNSEFNEFSDNGILKTNTVEGIDRSFGFYFSNKKNIADYFKGNNGITKPYFLKIKNPSKLSIENLNTEYILFYKDMGSDGIIWNRGSGVWINNKKMPLLKGDIEEIEYIAFYPNQIKLADGTNTTFDANSNDIRYNKGGETNNNYLATIITNDDLLFCEMFNYAISHKELMQTYSDKGIIIKEAEIIKESEYEKGSLLREEKISVSTLHNKNKTIPTSFINKQLAIGIKVEMEHTDNIEIAKEIALVHLKENIFYYEYLNKMEKELDQLDIDKHYEEIKESYGDGGTVNEVFSFKTPTGEKSRLTYIQQVLVRTSAFKNWFGDWDVAAKRFLADGRNNLDKHYKTVSKVLDYVTLEPRVVYHGTKAEKEFEEFDVTKKEGIGRPYAYFAQNKEYAENFTTSSQRGASSAKPILFNCFLNIRNPFYANTDKYVDVSGNYKHWINTIAETIYQNKYSNETEDFKKAVINSIESQISNYIKETYYYGDNKFWVLMARDSNKFFKFFLLSYDFDGVFYSEELSSNYDIEKPNQFTYAYTIFSADEVKLADGRNTKFNPFTNNIKLEQGGTISDVDNNVNQQINDMNKIEQLESILEKGGSFFKKGGSVNNNDFNSKLKHNFAEHNNAIPKKDHSKKLIETIYGNK